MKWFWVLFSVFILSTCTKHYCLHNTNFGYHNFDESISLKRNGQFRYWNNRRGVETIGLGKYQIVEDHLILNFEPTNLKLKFNDSISIHEDKNIEIDLQVLDFNQKPVISYSIVAYENDQLIEGLEGDHNGQVHFNLPNHEKPIKFLFSALEFKRRYFIINAVGKYQLTSILENENIGMKHIIQDEVWKYKIDTFTKDSLVIFKEYDSLQSFYRCRK